MSRAPLNRCTIQRPQLMTHLRDGCNASDVTAFAYGTRSGIQRRGTIYARPLDGSGPGWGWGHEHKANQEAPRTASPPTLSRPHKGGGDDCFWQLNSQLKGLARDHTACKG